MPTLDEIRNGYVAQESTVSGGTTPKASVVPTPEPTMSFENLARSLDSVIAEVKANPDGFEKLEAGNYTGSIASMSVVLSKAGKQMVKIEMDITTFGGLQVNGKRKAWTYLMLEHDKEVVVKMAMQKLMKMFAAVGIVLGETIDLNTAFTNINSYFAGMPVQFEQSAEGFTNIKNVNSKAV